VKNDFELAADEEFMADVFEAVIRVWEKYPFLTPEQVETVVAAVARIIGSQ
jgi:hypothetical protein